MLLATLCLMSSTLFTSANSVQASVFEITTEESTVKFDVEASVAIVGKFDKWDAKLTFTSPDFRQAFWTLRFRLLPWIPETE